MRHPLHALSGQGFWYTLANVLSKLGGLVLLPIYSDTAYLSVGSFGRWGVFEVTAQIAVAILGLQLGAGLIRFYPEADRPERVASSVWWMTLAVALGAGGVCLGLLRLWAPASDLRLYMLLLAWIMAELLLAVPLALLRVRRQAARYALLSVLKLGLVIGLSVLWLVYYRRGLAGLVQAYAVAGGVALLAGLVLSGPTEYVASFWDRGMARSLLRFSLPLVVGGLGSMVLNAGDRYMLKLFTTNEDLALYTMAAKFGGVVNMFGVQPLMMAFLPIFFHLAAAQRAEVLRLLMRYLVVGFGLLVVGLSLFTGPVLQLLGADEFYQQAVPLVPWIALGFAVFGLSILFDGVLTLFHHTGASSGWVTGAAVLNVALNLLMIPWLGPFGAAVTTFIAYGFLFGGRLHTARRLLEVPYAWGMVGGVVAVTAAVAFLGVYLPFPEGPGGWLVRSGLMLAWGGAILLGGWFAPEDVGRAWARLRQAADEVPAADGDRG